MAKQNGLIKILGTVGDMTYYRSKDGYLSKEKTSLTAERIASDPKFKRTRENMAEFGRAAEAGKLVRNGVNILLKDAKDGKVVSRLTKAMMQVLKTDLKSRRGQRLVALGDITLLKSFDFNATATLSATVYVPFEVNVDRPSGVINITIAPFAPGASIIAPEGATHFKFVSAALAADFSEDRTITSTTESDVLPWNEQQVQEIILKHQVTANTVLPVLLLFGIQFFQQVNGILYPLMNGSRNPLSVINVDIAQ